MRPIYYEAGIIAETNDRMKTTIIAVILFLSTFSSLAYARPAALTADRIEHYLAVEPFVYAGGPFAGLEVDLNSKRPVTLLPELETETSIFVSHFFNQGKFWVAEIQKDSVKSVVMQLALFAGPAGYQLAHMQYRFMLDTPAKLYRVVDGDIRSTQTGDMIFTIQAAVPIGKTYNPAVALLRSYKIVGRLVNSFDRAQLEEQNGGDTVTQYELKNMSSEQKNSLLMTALSFSTRYQMTKDYLTATENCISVSFDLLDAAMGIESERVTLNFKNVFLNGKSPNEKMVLDALTERRLIDSTSRMENY